LKVFLELFSNVICFLNWFEVLDVGLDGMLLYCGVVCTSLLHTWCDVGACVHTLPRDWQRILGLCLVKASQIDPQAAGRQHDSDDYSDYYRNDTGERYLYHYLQYQPK